MTKILITGANGQLGSELRNLLDERGVAYDAFDSKGLDITDKQAVDAKFDALRPEVVYHCAAYTAVDNAEDEGKQANWKVNEDGTRNVAEAAKRVGTKMVYISTDYVFDGTNPDEYQVNSTIQDIQQVQNKIDKPFEIVTCPQLVIDDLTNYSPNGVLFTTPYQKENKRIKNVCFRCQLSPAYKVTYYQ